jgi:hypothetical protein
VALQKLSDHMVLHPRGQTVFLINLTTTITFVEMIIQGTV